MQTTLDLSDELLGTSTEDECACLGLGAALEEVETLSTNLSLLEFVAGSVEKPLLKLDVPDAMCCCLDWINGGRIVCGLSNGELMMPLGTQQILTIRVPGILGCPGRSS